MTRKGFLARLAGAILGGGAVAATAQQPADDPLARRQMIEDLTSDPLPDELARKARSENALRARGVKVLETLPVITGESRSLRRTDREVAERTLGAMIAAVKGETGDVAMGQALLKQFGAAGYQTPVEAAFMGDADPDPQLRTDVTWRYEGVLVLMWALGLIAELPPEDQLADVAMMGGMLRDLGADGLFAQADLRPQADILDMADYMYRLHWSVTDARLKDEELPEGTDASIMVERCRALNWLYGYAGQDWDHVTADT